MGAASAMRERTPEGAELHAARMAVRLSAGAIWHYLMDGDPSIDVRPWRILDWEFGEGELTADELRRIWELVSARTKPPRWAE